jgi:hypothetical protein
VRVLQISTKKYIKKCQNKLTDRDVDEIDKDIADQPHSYLLFCTFTKKHEAIKASWGVWPKKSAHENERIEVYIITVQN